MPEELERKERAKKAPKGRRAPRRAENSFTERFVWYGQPKKLGSYSRGSGAGAMGAC